MNNMINSNMKKIVLCGIVAISSFAFVVNDYKSYIKKDNEFRKFMNDVRKLEKESKMTREIAEMIIEESE